MSDEIAKATQQAMILEKAIKRATTDKGISYYSLNSELQKAGTSASKLVSILASGGDQFAASLNAANKALATADRSLLSVNTKIKEMSRVLTQSFKFTAAQTFLQGVSNSIREAYQWAVDLNSTITNIGVVTGYTGDQLTKVTENAIAGARELRIAANEYAQGALIFYQQGLGDDEVARRTEITAKAARAAGSDLQAMSSQLTAIWNTYKMTGDEMERAASVGAKMAGDTAVDFADIAEAMQTAAAPAEQMGVSYNSLAAIIATVGDTTQQSASVIGNAFKTIFSRFQQLKSEGTDGEVTLNRVSSQLQELGVNVLDSAGNLRSLDSVIAEVGDQWDGWSSKQQLAIAQLVGGTRQYGQFLTLMNNFDKYQDLLSSANIEDGSTLEQQYEASLDSIESHAENAAESMRRAFGQIFDEEALKGIYSTIEGIGNLLGGLIDGVGGLPGILGIVATLISGKITKGLIDATRSAKEFVSNLTPTQRAANIDKQYAKMGSEIDTQLQGISERQGTGDLSDIESKSLQSQKDALNIQKQKLSFDHQVAKINDELNSKLVSATGSYKIQLEYQKQLLANAQELYTSATDRLSVLDKQAEAVKQQQNQDSQAAERKVSTASKQYDKAAEEYMRASDNGASPEQLLKLQAKMEAAARKLAEAQLEADEAGAYEKTREGLADVIKEMSKVSAGTGDMENVTKSLQNIFDSAKADNASDEFLQAIKDAQTNLENLGEEAPQHLNEIVDSLIEVAKQAGISTAALEELAESYIDASADQQRATTERQQAGSAPTPRTPSGGSSGGESDQQTSSFQNFKTLMSDAEGFEQITTGIAEIGTAAVTATLSVANLFTTLADGSASGTEKLSAVAGTFLTLIPTVMTLSTSLITMAGTLKAAGVAGALAGKITSMGFLPLTAIILGIVAALAVLTIAFKAIGDAIYNASPEGKLEAAEEAAAALNTQLEETKSRAEEVASAFENYNSVVDNLNNCVKGTEEWKDALAEVNNQVISLIQDFPELTTMVNEAGQKAITRNEDGQLEIADWAQDEILQKQEDAVTAAQGAAFAGQQNVREARIGVQRSNLGSSLYSEAGGLSAGDFVAGGLATLINPLAGIATALGGLKSADLAQESDIIAANAEELSGLVGEELTNKLSEVFKENNISADVDKWAGIIEGMGSDFTELSAAIQANTEAMNIENQQMADQIMADSGYDNSTAGSMALEAGGEIYGQLQQQAYEKYMNTDMADWLGVGTSEGKSMWADYADAMGISDLDGYKVTNYRKDGGVEYEYIDENGQKQTGEATKEMIASTLAAADAAEQLEGNLSELRATIADLNASANAYDRAMASFLSEGNFEGASVGELDSIRQQVGFQDTTGLEGQALTDAQNANKQAVTDYVNSALGGDDGVLSDEEAQAMGYESANAFIEAFTEGLDVDIELPSGLGEGIADQLSVGASKAINDTYEKMGEEGGQAYLDTLQTIYDSVDWSSMTPEEARQAWDQIANIDWSNMDAADQAAQIVKNLGGEIDTTTEAWKNNTVAMQDAMDATYDVASEMEKIKAAKEIASDIEIGAVISEDDYNTLVAYNEELSKYFTLLADGTYKMIGDPLDLQQEMIETERKKLEDMIARDQDLLAEAASQYSSGIAALGGDANNLDQYRDTENYVGDDGENHYDRDNVYRQLDFLQSQGYDQEKITGWLDDLSNGDTTTDVLEDIAKAVDETGVEFQEAGQAVNAYNAELLALQTSYAMTAESSAERRQMLEDNKISEDAFLTAEYAAMNEEAWEGLDVEEVQAYADHLQEMGVEGEEAAEDIARGITKMNKGISTLSDNWEDWGDILKSANEEGHEAAKFSEEYAEALTGTKEAISDILDVSEEFIDSDFISKPENLELIGKAAEGDAEAIDELGMALANDIFTDALENVTLDADDLFNFGNLEEKKTYLQQQMADIQSILETSIPTYDLGQTIDDTNLIAKLNNIVAETGMTVEEANAFYRSMGFTPNFKMVEVSQAQSVPITTTYHRLQNYTPEYDDEGNWIGASWDETEWSNTEQVDGGELVSRFPSLAMQTADGEGPMVPSPEIESLTYDGGGAMNNNSTVNKGGNTGNGGGNGGGGGSTPKHSAKNASKYESIKDRYSTIKSSIDEVQRSVDALSDAEDDAWGASKVRNIQKINAELQKQAKNLQQLRKLSLNYLETDKKDAQIAAKDLITNLTKEGLPGLNLDQVLFNGEGFVRNRTELTTQLDNYLKALYEPYYQAAMAYDRANSTDEAESERIDKLKEKYDVAKAFVDEFLASLDLVDETAQEAADALEQQLENIREWMANKVEEATYKMEFQIGINERDISLIEQAIELWGDLGTMMGKTFDQLGKKMREETENFNLTLEHGNRMIEIINNINPSNANRDWFIGEFGEEAWNKYITGNGGLPTEVLDAMQDDADSMIEYMNSMYDIAEEMFGQYIEVLNMYMDEFDKIADKISANNDKLEMFTELLEFSGKKWTSDGRDAIRSIADATVDNAQLEVERAANALELAKQGAEETTAQLEEFYAEHGRDAEGYNDTEAFVYNQLKAAKDEADELLADAQSDMTSSIQDLASAAADAIEMVAEVIKDEVVENLGGDFASFDDMTTMYDQQYDLDTFFLRDFDKEYQLNSLLGDIDDQMENITDPGRLKEYEALIEEINAANQEGVDLTQTDVDLLKAKFEIQKAQDAYEEAQNAKNTMRLARDASGNWNYVYSSDQSETDDAAQALADAQYNYEKLLWEASDEASQYWLQAQQEFFQFQETIDWARYEHDAEYKNMIDQQLAYYQQKTELYANQIVKYNGMLDVAFEDTTLGVITNCKDMNSAQEWYTTQHTKYTNDLKQNTKDYQGQVEETCNQVGIKYDELEETVKTETELMGKENDALREKIKTLNTEGSRALSKLDDKVRNFRENFIQHMEACQKKLEAFLKTLKQMENASIDEMYNTGFDAGTDYTAEIHNYIGQKLEEGYTKEQLLADEGLKSLVTELKNKLGSEELYYAGHGTVNDKWGQQGWDFVDKYLQSAVDEAMNYFLSGNFEIWDTVDEWVKNHPNWRELAQQNWGKPPETATGGLIRTPQIRSVAEDGAELILNSEDTKNILSAVAHMRDIVKMKMSSINGTLGKKTSGVVDKTIINKDIQQIEQQVHIDATFPNVSVASEIEEAFSNLVNQAVQYVSQKNHQ